MAAATRLLSRFVLAAVVMALTASTLDAQQVQAAKEAPSAKEPSKAAKKRPSLSIQNAREKAPQLARVAADSKNPMVRKQAARALERMGTAARPVLPDLRKALAAETDTEVKEALEHAIEQIDPPFDKLPWQELTRRLTDGTEDAKTRKQIIKTLGHPRFRQVPNVRAVLEQALLDDEFADDAAAALEQLDRPGKAGVGNP